MTTQKYAYRFIGRLNLNQRPVDVNDIFNGKIIDSFNILYRHPFLLRPLKVLPSPSRNEQTQTQRRF